MNSVLIGLLLAGLGLGSSWYYRMDAIESKAFYQSELARITAESAESKRQSEEYNHGIETQRIKDKEAADNRIQQLAKRQRPVVTSCTTSADAVVSAGISADAVRLLRDTANDPRLSAPDDPTGFVGADETVTADSVDAYARHAINERNECAVNFNAIQQMVK